MTMNIHRARGPAGHRAAAGTLSAHAADISGAGSTFIYPVFAKWADTYKKDTGTGMNYQSIGSGGGIKQIKASTVTFGATDAPLTEADLEDGGLVQWPMIMGGIVPVVNLEGIKAGDLTLDGPTLAAIFMGTIKTWNDPGHRQAEPRRQAARDRRSWWCIVRTGRARPSTSPTTCPRCRPTGSPRSARTPPSSGRSASAPRATRASPTTSPTPRARSATSNTPMPSRTTSTSTKMVNHDGKAVAPAMDTFSSAAANADWEHAPGFYQILTDQPGAQSWPITASTFVLMHKEPKDAAAAAEALKFFNWAFKNGTKEAEALDYIPMPAKVVTLIDKEINGSIKAGGKPVYEMK